MSALLRVTVTVIDPFTGDVVGAPFVLAETPAAVAFMLDSPLWDVLDIDGVPTEREAIHADGLTGLVRLAG